MKKSITIPNVDTDLYEAVKERCRQDGTSISAYFNSLLAGQVPTADESEKIKELTAQIVQLTEQLAQVRECNSKQARENLEKLDECAFLKGKNDLLQKAKTELEKNLTAKDTELEEARNALETMKTRIESLRASSDNGVFVELTPLELALIKHVAEKEQARHEDETITPSTLLKAMFVNYTIHGDMYFFPHPSRSTLRALKAQVEEAELLRRKNTHDTPQEKIFTPQKNHETPKGEDNE